MPCTGDGGQRVAQDGNPPKPAAGHTDNAGLGRRHRLPHMQKGLQLNPRCHYALLLGLSGVQGLGVQAVCAVCWHSPFPAPGIGRCAGLGFEQSQFQSKSSTSSIPGPVRHGGCLTCNHCPVSHCRFGLYVLHTNLQFCVEVLGLRKFSGHSRA